MTPDQLREHYPQWTIWELGGIWYATGACPAQFCECRRTLHSPTLARLAQVLAEALQPAIGSR
ncbi:hypothetical protein Hesp01_67100 [Herbidospora sp. NBRC 101105]|nr:hypothetical protein Hesp01_67100 [Herbidospora sp. NBRC 101105]